MIRILGRKLLFDTDEQYLGTTYDAETGTRTFVRDRRSPDSMDLSNLGFYVLLNYKDGSVDMMDLKKSVTDKTITLIWDLNATIFKHEGYAFIWIRATDENKVVRWSSEKAVVYITEEGNGDFSPTSADSAALAAIEKAEKERVTAEADRKTAEEARATAETERAQAEAARTDAETKRAQAETDRADAETERDSAEKARKEAEANRVSAETTRGQNEAARVQAEESRVEAENARVSAENARTKAETKRQQAETTREEAYDDFVNAKDELQGYAATSRSWAVGGTGTRDGEDTDNSKYYAEQSKTSKEAAAASEANAATSEKNAADSATAAETSKTNAQNILNDISSLANISYATSEQIDSMYTDGTVPDDKRYVTDIKALQEYDSNLQNTGSDHINATDTNGITSMDDNDMTGKKTPIQKMLDGIVKKLNGISLTGENVTVKDTNTVIEGGTAGSETTLQKLLDSISDRIMNTIMKKMVTTDAFQNTLKNYLVNNFTTTEEGFAADARALATLNSDLKFSETITLAASDSNIVIEYRYNKYFVEVYCQNGTYVNTGDTIVAYLPSTLSPKQTVWVYSDDSALSILSSREVRLYTKLKYLRFHCIYSRSDLG